MENPGPDELLDAAFAHLSRDEFAEAVAVLKDLIENYPGASEARTAFTGLSYAFTHTKDYQLLNFIAGYAGHATPLSNEADLALARTYEVAGNLGAARASARQAEKFAFDAGYHFRALTTRYLIEHHDREFAEAEQILASMKPSNADQEEFLASLGWLLSREVGTDEAYKNEFAIVDSQQSVANNESPDGFVVNQYPNPFNPQTTIRFRLSEAGPTTLIVYDLLGRTIRTLVDERLAEGTHEAVFDATGIATGTYVYRLVAPNVTRSGTMLYLK